VPTERVNREGKRNVRFGEPVSRGQIVIDRENSGRVLTRWSRTRVFVHPDAHPTDRRQKAGGYVRLDAAEINIWLRDAEDKDQADAEQSLVKATRAGCKVSAGPQRRLSQDSLLLYPAHHFVGPRR